MRDILARRASLRAAALTLMLAVGAAALPAPAAAQQAKEPAAAEQLEEAAQRLFDMLKSILKSIPMYEAPEILENGDIIIRRVRPEPEPPDTTKT